MKSAKGVPSSFATTKTFENGVALTLLSVTVFFWSPALDAFNYPKSAVLSISTTSLFVLVLPKLIQTFKPNRNQWIHLLPTLYLIWLFAGALFHGVHKTEILWGVFSRANGLITSASFLILTILLTLNVSKTLLLRILYAALSALTLITIYGFIQLAGKDPVNWVNPYNQIISTFGNPNFSSAAIVVLSLACLALVVDRETSAFLRIFTGLLIVSSLFLSYKSQSLQGIVSFLAAIQVYFVTKLFLRKL